MCRLLIYIRYVVICGHKFLELLYLVSEVCVSAVGSDICYHTSGAHTSVPGLFEWESTSEHVTLPLAAYCTGSTPTKGECIILDHGCGMKLIVEGSHESCRPLCEINP